MALFSTHGSASLGEYWFRSRYVFSLSILTPLERGSRIAHGEIERSKTGLHPEKPTLLDYCCLSQGVPPQPLVTMLWLGESAPRRPSDFKSLWSHYSRLLVILCLWSGELKGAVFYCSSNNVLTAPSAPPPGATAWQHERRTQERLGVGLFFSRMQEWQMRVLSAECWVNLRWTWRGILP